MKPIYAWQVELASFIWSMQMARRSKVTRPDDSASREWGPLFLSLFALNSNRQKMLTSSLYHFPSSLISLQPNVKKGPHLIYPSFNFSIISFTPTKNSLNICHTCSSIRSIHVTIIIHRDEHWLINQYVTCLCCIDQ